jgi:hypothetical protein
LVNQNLRKIIPKFKSNPGNNPGPEKPAKQAIHAGKMPENSWGYLIKSPR